jgi:hypothetical protein
MNSTLTKIDDCLSWIELEVAFETKAEARETHERNTEQSQNKDFQATKTRRKSKLQ